MIPRLLLVTLFASAALAQEPRLIALDGPLGSGAPALVERFLGEDAIISAVFLRTPNASFTVTADVYLDGGALAAPMNRGIAFHAVADATHPALLEGSLSLPPPATEKPVTQLVRLNAALGDAAPVLAGSFRLRWISRKDCLAALKSFVTPGVGVAGSRILLAGPLPGLREQLQAWQIPFNDSGKETPLRAEPGALTIGEDAPDGVALPDMGEKSSLLLVRLRPVACPEIWRKDSGATRITLLTMPQAVDWRQSPFLIRTLTEHLTASTP